MSRSATSADWLSPPGVVSAAVVPSTPTTTSGVLPLDVFATVDGGADLHRDIAQEGDLGDVLLKDESEGLAAAEFLHRIGQLDPQGPVSNLLDQIVLGDRSMSFGGPSRAVR